MLAEKATQISTIRAVGIPHQFSKRQRENKIAVPRTEWHSGLITPIPVMATRERPFSENLFRLPTYSRCRIDIESLNFFVLIMPLDCYHPFLHSQRLRAASLPLHRRGWWK